MCGQASLLSDLCEILLLNGLIIILTGGGRRFSLWYSGTLVFWSFADLGSRKLRKTTGHSANADEDGSMGCEILLPPLC